MVDYLYNYNYINNLISLPPLIPQNAFFQTTKLLRYDTLRLLRNKCKRKKIMATTIPTQPGRLTVDFEDISMLRDIKKAISMVRGVTKVTVPRTKRLSSYERSLRDLDEGRVYEYDSLDDLIKEIEG